MLSDLGHTEYKGLGVYANLTPAQHPSELFPHPIRTPVSPLGCPISLKRPEVSGTMAAIMESQGTGHWGSIAGECSRTSAPARHRRAVSIIPSVASALA